MKEWINRLFKLIKKESKDYNVNELRESAQKMIYGAHISDHIVKGIINHVAVKDLNKNDEKQRLNRSGGLNAGLGIVFFRLEDVMKNSKPYLDKNFSLEKLSLKAGTNRTYASNAINNIAGCSFNKYVNRYRLEHATNISMKSADNIEIENIAVMSGYKDVRSFLIALYDSSDHDFKFLKNKYLCSPKKQKYLF